MLRHLKCGLLAALSVLNSLHASAHADTLRLMTYNVLYYGDTPPCQAPHSTLHGYLKTIIGYTRPDILGLVKMAAPLQEGNRFATAPVNFPDSVLQYALNAAIPGTYTYCPYTNNAHANNVEVLFYNQDKLGYVSTIASYINLTDFNTYKLYYRSADLATTHDTTFLYVTLNHDKSGDEYEQVRGAQIRAEMENIRSHFTSLPNMINMGDFNTRSSGEQCYKALVFPSDTAFRFFDPPFYEGKLKYPADWDNDRANFAAYLTTSTRKDKTVPNPCGSGGGAKNWYDHIFLSSWIMNNSNRISYIPNSYRTVGNDGNRYKISINEPSQVNTSAPAEVIEALYQMSNKYPVMAELLVETGGQKIRPPQTEVLASAPGVTEHVTVDNLVAKEFLIHFSSGLIGEEMNMECFDEANHSLFKNNFKVKDINKKIGHKLKPGNYALKFYSRHSFLDEIKVTVK
ncbi:MAG: hypothetical protein JSS82_02785 [Bacteroidetes bacterium]|nr:hypothetical protein [Bacteroidota bacterium]